MLKKSLMFFSVVFLVGTLIIGCSSPTGAAGKDGEPGAPGGGGGGGGGGNGSETAPAQVSGSQTTADIQAQIDDDVSITFYNLTQSNAGTITIPAGRTVTLSGSNAIKLHASGILVVESAASLGGTGKINLNGGILIAEASVIENWTTGSTASAIAIPTSGVVVSGTNVVAKAETITITGENTEGNNIDKDEISTSTIYVFGNLEVSDTVALTKVIVAGDVTASHAITGTVEATGEVAFTGATAQTALTSLTAGSVTSSANIGTTNNGDITVAGALTTTGAATITVNGIGKLTAGSLTTGAASTLTVGTGPITIAGTANIGGNLVATTGTVTFNGPATITGTLAATTGTLAFNGATASTVTGVFTPGGAATISGTGAVAFTEAIGDTSTNTVTIKNTGGVTLTAANTLAANLVATGVTITGETTTGVVIDKDATNIVVPTGAFITVPDTGTGLVVGSTNTVTIKGATLKVGTYTGAAGMLTLAANTEIEVGNGGEVAIAGSGKLAIGAATSSKVTLLAGGRIIALTADGDIDLASSNRAKILLTVGTTADPATPAMANISGTTPFTVAVGSPGNTQDVIVGKIKWSIVGGTPAVYAGDTASAAIGTLIAGDGTTITITGS
jgi:filamentous hemagglutinin